MLVKDAKMRDKVQLRNGTIATVIGTTDYGVETQDLATVVLITGKNKGNVIDVRCINLKLAPERKDWPM